MAGCVPCFIIPLLLFIFHRYIQPIILRFWNPWAKKDETGETEQKECKFSCDCSWNKKNKLEDTQNTTDNENETKLKTS